MRSDIFFIRQESHFLYNHRNVTFEHLIKRCVPLHTILCGFYLWWNVKLINGNLRFIKKKKYRIDVTAKHLTEVTSKCFKYLNRWKLRAHQLKTEAIIFTWLWPQLNDNIIINESWVKYLSVHLDSKLNFIYHINFVCNKVIGLVRQLYLFYNKSSQLDMHNKTLLYYLYVRPVITYTALIWANTCKSNYWKLSIVQNVYG